MHSLEVVLSDAAVEDLSDIWAYIGAEHPNQADQLIDELYEKCQLLATMPEMGRRRDELVFGIRSFSVRRYLIFYRIRENYLEIVRIVGGQQDLPSLF